MNYFFKSQYLAVNSIRRFLHDGTPLYNTPQQHLFPIVYFVWPGDEENLMLSFGLSTQDLSIKKRK